MRVFWLFIFVLFGVLVAFFAGRSFFRRLTEPRPVDPDPRPRAWAPRRLPPVARAAPPADAPLVLVIDDSRTLREMVRRLLEPEGIRVAEASDLAAVRVLLASADPGLLLVDAGLIGPDGRPLLASLLELPDLGGQPVVLLRGAGAESGVGASERIAAEVPKPFDSQALLDAVFHQLPPDHAPAICPVCEQPVGEPHQACPACGARHHPECYSLNDGCGRCD